MSSLRRKKKVEKTPEEEEEVKAEPKEETPKKEIELGKIVGWISIGILVFGVAFIPEAAMIFIVAVVCVAALVFFFRQNSWKIVLGAVSVVVVGVFVGWINGIIFDFLSFNKTPLPPLIVLAACIIICLYAGKILKSQKDDKDRRVYYALWIVFATLLDSYSHFRMWYLSFIAALVVFTIVYLIYKSINRLEKATIWPRHKDGRLKSIEKSRHELFTVLFSARRKTWYLVLLLAIVSIELPVGLVVFFGPNNWWHVIVSVATYCSGIWLWYSVWVKFRLVQLPELVDDPEKRYSGERKTLAEKKKFTTGQKSLQEYLAEKNKKP